MGEGLSLADISLLQKVLPALALGHLSDFTLLQLPAPPQVLQNPQSSRMAETVLRGGSTQAVLQKASLKREVTPGFGPKWKPRASDGDLNPLAGAQAKTQPGT